MSVAPDLPEKYYLDNFIYLLNHVSQLYADILNESERAFFDDFLSLSEDAQSLYVRLLSRRGDWFRRDKIIYSEISDIDGAAGELTSHRFIQIYSIGLGMIPDETDWLNLYTRPELASAIQAQADQKPASSLRKPELLALMMEEPEVYVPDLPDTDIYCVYGEQELETFRLLFFGNLYQDFTEFVLRDLGIYRYESYHLNSASRWCHQRADLEAHRLYHALREEAGDLKDQSIEALCLIADRLPASDEPTLRRRRHRFLVDIGRQLERLGYSDDALAVYERSVRHPARERRLRILVSQGRNNEADALASDMADAPVNEEEHQFLLSFVPRKMKYNHELCRRLADRVSSPEEDILTMPAETRLSLGVERAVAAALESESPGDRLVYCENLLIPGMFGLVFWSAIYAAVPGAFFHPFQMRPADLYEADFMALRKSEFDTCWQALESSDVLLAHALFTYQQKQGIANPFVHWAVLTEDLIRLSVERIPVSAWQGMFRFLVKDLRQHKAGLPDLIRFPKNEGFELLEVKGPGDTLQKNQKVWFAEFERSGIPARVIRVKDDPTVTGGGLTGAQRGEENPEE